MGFKIPGKFSEITLRDFIAWHEAKTPVQKLCAMGARLDEVRKMQSQAVKQIVDTIDDVMDLKTALHVKMIRHENTDYGFIPDVTSMSYGEHADLTAYAKSIWGEKTNYTMLPELMCILYRPITESLKDRYRIKEYDSERVDHKEAILSMSMDKVQGALLFFSSIRTKLQNASLPFLDQAMKKAMMEVEAMEID